MIDWSVAERVAEAVAGPGTPEHDLLPGDLPALALQAEEAVSGYTRMRPLAPLPPIEAVGRVAWSRANLVTMRGTFAPLAEKLDAAGGGGLAGPLRNAGSLLVGVEMGGLVGWLGRRVLGQYELSLLDPTAGARLLLVAPNLHGAAADMDVPLPDLLAWVAFHEVTHAVQFASVPWLREHLGGLIRELLESADVRVDVGALLKMPDLQDLRALAERLRDGDVVGVVLGPERRAVLDRVQSAMALVEGHAEHVMDAAGGPFLPNLERLRGALDRRRRERPPLQRLLERLLGLEMKMRQYEVGRGFVDGVVEIGGIDALNRAWASPEMLPSLDELRDPGAWVRRTQVRAVTRGA
ncbi:MAG TPA: zinc-dependent metalloprotease [Solirubrobacteraceae bacterium]|nr:zinc-dependent metalloprotease [Solirubrobacteraceae bacterium]